MLTPKQKKFADEYLDTGNATAAATKAYRPKKRGTARSMGSENLTKPDIRDYIEGKMHDAAARVYKLAMSSKSEAIQLRASQDILDRGGLKATDKLSVGMSDGETFLDAIRRAAEIRKERQRELKEENP